MKMRKISIKFTTAADGSVTANHVSNVLGKLYAVLYKPGSILTGATVTVTCQGVFAKPLLTKANAGTADTLYYPRDIPHAVADGAALTATAGGDRVAPLLNGVPRVVIASGGNAKSGEVILYYED
jgi:hypothetical protein